MSLAWQAFALTTVALFLKMISVAVFQGIQRIKNKAFANPEDAALFANGAAPLPRELPLVERGQSVLRNDIENIPIFLFLMLAYAQVGAWPMGAAIYGAIFVFARIVHSVAYINSRQPFRTLSYACGVTLMFIMSGQIVAAALS
jgi:uncharacterized membrane protein YecN with MAPEG domain